MNLPIIYEDEQLVAVNKPAGVMTHPDGKTSEETVSDWFAARYPESKDVGEVQKLPDGTELTRPGVVHRLDRDTSGVIVLAKTQEAHAFLKSAFQNREAKKTYVAFVYGIPKERRGVIEFAIGRSRKDFRLRSAQPKAKGLLREAVTRYEVIADNGTHSIMKAMPETGRTHQIRVHLKAIHHPVVGDTLYAPGRPEDLGFNRLGLHAYRLELPSPTGEPRILTAPLPEELMKGVEKFPEGAARIASI
ncbi:RluA family pseudouridine synthase [Patescibacteria group bacterium]|nr:RluA family pseudouridine synthase [Patescibacteria group bacterium]